MNDEPDDANECPDCEGTGECEGCSGDSDGINRTCALCDNSGACQTCNGEGILPD